MIPTLVTGPVASIVSLGDLRLHCRVDATLEDIGIQSFADAATAYLDGWRGILGRAIMPQTWAQEFTGWGELRLAMPDVTAIRVTYIDIAGASVAATSATLTAMAIGPVVIASGPATSLVRVEYDCAMPAQQLPSAQHIVKLLVSHWYSNRDAAIIGTISSDTPMAVDMLVGALRWRNI